MHTTFTGACFCCRYWHLYLCVWHFHRVVFALISGSLGFVFHLLLLHLSPFLHVSYSFHVILWSLFLCMLCGHRLRIYRAVPVRLHCVIYFLQGRWTGFRSCRWYNHIYSTLYSVSPLSFPTLCMSLPPPWFLYWTNVTSVSIYSSVIVQFINVPDVLVRMYVTCLLVTVQTCQCLKNWMLCYSKATT